MDTPQSSTDAFQRPLDDLNKVGFGLRQFVNVETIFKGMAFQKGSFIYEIKRESNILSAGFLVNDSIIIRAFVVPENDMVKTDDDTFLSESGNSFEDLK